MNNDELRQTADAEKLKKEIEKLENDIRAKTVKKQEALKKLKLARSKARTKKGLNIFDEVVALLDLTEAEAKCVTIADYAKLQDDVIAAINELQQFKKEHTDIKSEPK